MRPGRKRWRGVALGCSIVMTLPGLALAQGVGVSQGVNQPSELRVDPTGGGLQVEARGRQATFRTVELRRSGGTRRGLPALDARIDGDWVRYAHDGLTEWFVAGPRGVEHGWTLAQAPPGRGPLEIVVHVDGLSARQAGAGALLGDEAGTWLGYDEVFALDAAGRELECTIDVVAPDTIVIRVRDEGAAYPIEVDPLIWGVRRTLRGGADSRRFAWHFDRDGDWLAVGEPADVGEVHMYRRVDGQWVFDATLAPPAGVDPDASFGSRIEVAGETVAVASPVDDTSEGVDAGSVHLFERTGGAWAHVASLGAEGAGPDQLFGRSMALDSSMLAIGYCDLADTEDPGSVAIYERTPAGWAHVETVRASAAGDRMCSASVDYLLWVDGALVYGAPAQVNQPGGVGSVFIFERGAGGFVETQRLPPRTGATAFGETLAYSDGFLFVGTSRTRVFAPADTNLPVYYYERVGGVWTYRGSIAPPTDRDTVFGREISAAAGRVAISAPGYRWPDDREGAVFLYRIEADGTVTLQTTLEPGLEPVRFGWTTHMEGEDLLVSDHSAWVGGVRVAGELYHYVFGLTDGEPCLAGAECVTGYCVDGVCCAEACGGGAADCMACSRAAGASEDGTCGPVAADRNLICRPTAGLCDLAEVCDGASTECPADEVWSDERVCREAEGACDAPERCDGESPVCPEDALRDEGAECDAPPVCGSAAGACDGLTAVCRSLGHRECDAGAARDAGLDSDASSGDGGTRPGGTSGCSCHVVSARLPRGAAIFSALLVLAAATLRRRGVR
ncbi:MAG: hypothetical protein RLO52_41870 [Sandaracinaceae bacterium]